MNAEFKNIWAGESVGLCLNVLCPLGAIAGVYRVSLSERKRLVVEKVREPTLALEDLYLLGLLTSIYPYPMGKGQ